MSNALIAFFMAGGASMWVYKKINRSTGGNTTNTLVVTVVAGVFTFIVGIVILGLIPS